MTSKSTITLEAFWAEAEYLGHSLMAQMEYFEALGVTEVPASLAPPQRPAAIPRSGHNAPRAQSAAVRPAGRRQQSAPAKQTSGPKAWAASAENLPALAELAANCQGCGLAGGERQQPFFGRGTDKPLMVFVGYGQEVYDGKTGELMKGIVEKGFNLNDSEYRVTSLIKCCRQTDSDDPPQASEACFPILRRELEILSPRIILAFGQSAGRWLTGRDEHLGLLKPHTYTLDWLSGALLRVTYDLGDMVDELELKKDAWRECQKMRSYIDKLRQK